MTENWTVPTEMTEEQAQVEIEKMRVEVRLLFEQIQRDRQESAKIAADTAEIMNEARLSLARLRAPYAHVEIVL